MSYFFTLLPPTVPESTQTCLSNWPSVSGSVCLSLGNPSGPGISMQTSLVIAFSTAQAACASHDSTHPTSVVCSFGLFSARQRLAFWGMQQLLQYTTTTLTAAAIVVATLGKLASSAQPINPQLDQEPRFALHCGFLFAFLQLFFLRYKAF